MFRICVREAIHQQSFGAAAAAGSASFEGFFLEASCCRRKISSGFDNRLCRDRFAPGGRPIGGLR
jgi:hypothetical protein